MVAQHLSILKEIDKHHSDLITKSRHIADKLVEFSFSSYGDLEILLQEVYLMTNSKFSIRSSEKLENYLQRNGTRDKYSNFDVQNLKFKTVHLECVHGSPKQSKANTKITTTKKQCCPAYIKVSCNLKTLKLSIRKINLKHLDICYNTFLKPVILQTDIEKIVNNIRNGAKISRLTLELSTKYKFPFKLKDLHNISNKYISYIDVETAISHLESLGDLKVVKDNSNVTKGYLFQDQQMKFDWMIYGQFLIMDSTFKVINKSWSFFALVGEDNNKKTIIFAWFLLANETFEILNEAFKWFFNRNSPEVNKEYMTDKDFAERKVLGLFLPNSQARLYRFHVLRFWKIYISKGKFGLTTEKRKYNLQLLKKIVYCKSDREYADLLALLTPSVKEYYLRNWHYIRVQFIEFFKGHSMTMDIHTSNNVEAYFSSLKKFMKLKSNTGKFLLEIIDFINYKRNILKRADIMKQTRIQKIDHDSPIYFMSKVLSSFAFKLLLSSFAKLNSIGQAPDLTINQLNSCCRSRYTYLLPCEHVINHWLHNPHVKLEHFVHPRWYTHHKAHKITNFTSRNHSTQYDGVDGMHHQRVMVKDKNKVELLQATSEFKKTEASRRIYIENLKTARHSESYKFSKLRNLSDKLANRLAEHNDYKFGLYILDKILEDIEKEGITKFSEKFGIACLKEIK